MIFLILQSGELNRLSFYFDTDSEPWPTDKPWEQFLPPEWSKVSNGRKLKFIIQLVLVMHINLGFLQDPSCLLITIDRSLFSSSLFLFFCGVVFFLFE